MILSFFERRVLEALQREFPLERRPFAAIASRLDATEEQVLDAVRSLRERGVLRRIGVSVRHLRAGYTANALVCWRVEEEQFPLFRDLLRNMSEVSHCYRRGTTPTWPYNLYTVFHGTSRDTVERSIAAFANRLGDPEHRVLFSIREFKKSRRLPARDQGDGSVW